jgi:transcriptional regulator with GAF, ATPase, and Fis domain
MLIAGDKRAPGNAASNETPSPADVSRHAFFLGKDPRATDDTVALQAVISTLASQLAVTKTAAIDAEVNAALHQVADTLRLDVAMLWPRADAGDRPSHSWMQQSRLPVVEPAQLTAMRFLASRLGVGDCAAFTRLDQLPDPGDRDIARKYGIRSAVFVPFRTAVSLRGDRGALAVWSSTAEHEWPSSIVEQLRVLSAVIALALARRDADALWQRAQADLQQLRMRVADSAISRRPAATALRGPRQIVSKSAAVQLALGQLEHVAATTSTVLLLGETGVGKEVFAEAIHALSARRHRPMVRVSCAAIPASLMESELFGRERGAYTGAVTRQIGRFEAANQSTVFLDEIGELPLDVQVKLLRVLQERVIERLGSTASIKVDVRIVAATNRDLERAIEAKSFREDLFYRLNVFPIVIPPLRERVEDIPGLVWTLVDEIAATLGKTFDAISPASMRRLQEYPWPGNVRQLRNVIERAVIIADGPELEIDVPAVDTQRSASPRTLKDLETAHIRATLETTKWRVRGAGGAAERLGLKPTTLETRMAKLGLVRPNRSSHT